LPLRILLVLATLLLVGCSADGIYSPQTFFPGSTPSEWSSCDKFTGTGSEVQICASVGLLPGATASSYNISFWLPASTHVLISVFDSQAAFVTTLLDDDEPSNLPGQFRLPPVSWNYTDSAGKPVASGDYRIYFKAGDYVSTSDVVAP
jgi:hypothetical protein